MGINEPTITVECDKCGEVTDPYHLTMLAGGGWDDRNLRPRLRKEGFQIDGDGAICPTCLEDIAAAMAK